MPSTRERKKEAQSNGGKTNSSKGQAKRKVNNSNGSLWFGAVILVIVAVLALLLLLRSASAKPRTDEGSSESRSERRGGGRNETRSDSSSTSRSNTGSASTSEHPAKANPGKFSKKDPLQPAEQLQPAEEDMEGLPNKLLTRAWITPLLSPSECEWVINLAEEVDDWKPRLNYDTREVQLSQLPEFKKLLVRKGGLQDRIFALLRRQFKLPPDTRLDRFNSNIIRYDSLSNTTNHVLMHSDISHFTFNTLLSDHTTFTGGGTGMVHLNRTLFPPQGHMISYYGNAFHSGEPVTSGKRYIWQGFVNVVDRKGKEVKLDGDEETHIIFGAKALSLYPHLTDAWYSIGNLLREHGRLKESEVYLHSALAHGYKDKEVAYSKIAETFVQSQRLDEAHSVLKKAVKFNPTNDIVMKMHLDLKKWLKGRGRA